MPSSDTLPTPVIWRNRDLPATDSELSAVPETHQGLHWVVQAKKLGPAGVTLGKPRQLGARSCPSAIKPRILPSRLIQSSIYSSSVLSSINNYHHFRYTTEFTACRFNKTASIINMKTSILAALGLAALASAQATLPACAVSRILHVHFNTH